MKLIKWFKNLFKNESGIVPNEIKEKCRHDWETINKYAFLYFPASKRYSKTGDQADYFTKYSNRYWADTYQVSDEVCVKCGECHNGFKIMQEHNKKEKERKEYAKQLWENGCKK